MSLLCDSSKAERHLGYRGTQTSLEEMVEQSYRWLEQAGRL